MTQPSSLRLVTEDKYLKADNGGKPVGKGELVIRVTDAPYFAVGDGSTSDTVKINTALADAASSTSLMPKVVEIPYTPNGFASNGTINVPSGVTLRIVSRAKIKATAAMTRLVDITDGGVGVRLEGQGTLDPNGFVTSEIVRVGINTNRTLIEGLTLKGINSNPLWTPSTAYAVGDRVNGPNGAAYVATTAGTSAAGATGPTALGAGVSDGTVVWDQLTTGSTRQIYAPGTGTNLLSIKGCILDGGNNAIHVTGPATNTTVMDCEVLNWTVRGIYFAGTAAGCSGVTIERNTVRSMISGGVSRYPIRVEGPNTHTAVRVAGNKVYGRGTAFTDTTTPGTADQISMTYCDGLTLLGNFSYDGGDGGMTVEQGCKNVTVEANVIERPWVACLFVGSAATTLLENVTIGTNTFIDGNRGNQSIPGAAGVRLTNAVQVTLTGNIFDNQTSSGFMAYAVSATGCTDLTIGSGNKAYSLTSTFYFDGGGNTNVEGATSAQVLIGTAANETVNAVGPTTVWTLTPLPAGTFKVGSVFELDLNGTVDAKATSGNFTVQVFLGATGVSTLFSVAASQTGAATNLNWNARLRITVDAIGAGGSVSVTGQNTVLGAAGTSWTLNLIGVYGTAVNLGTSLAPVVKLGMGTADPANKNRINRAAFRQVA